MVKNQTDYKFCPFCGLLLQTTLEEEKKIKYCESCQWKYYSKHDIAVGGIAVRISREGQAETLMVLRKKEPNINKWSFPAGFVNYGEHPNDALAREVREETGLIVVRFELIDERISNDDLRSPNQFARYYKILVTGQIKNNDQGENSEIRWHSLNQLAPNPEIAWGHHQILFECLKNRGGLDSFLFRYGWISYNVSGENMLGPTTQKPKKGERK